MICCTYITISKGTNINKLEEQLCSTLEQAFNPLEGGGYRVESLHIDVVVIYRQLE